jgi:hypothetical protein
MTTILLNDAALAFKAHPRTLLRAVSGSPNPYWTEDHNPTISVEDLATAYSCSVGVLARIFEGRDILLTPAEAAKEIEVPDRTFRYRDYPSIRHGGIVRYARSRLLQRHYNKWET